MPCASPSQFRALLGIHLLVVLWLALRVALGFFGGISTKNSVTDATIGLTLVSL